ncbi:MAG: glutamine-hydrolyzing carbamoyl-phosphate synthase small subunit [Planctomycetes bacterium]|nr:glutamine-hydrolyzing carbamoyl-phosphate synthase small subunit [Planctomycetota bacterium]
MTGYQEILTDPSYAGQIVAMTYPQIGNYGINSKDVESKKIHCRGFIVRELSEIYSNFEAEQSLEDYLKDNNLAIMTEVDTRALTRALREKGAMKGCFLADGADKDEAMKKIQAFQYAGIDMTQGVVGFQEGAEYNKGAKHKVAVLDVGIKSNILRILSEFCELDVFTVDSFAQAKLNDYEGFFLSNGPGDPEAVKGAIAHIQSILKTGKPVFGICLGHQLLSLALGGKTFKLKFGHHGANHPVKNLLSGKVEISSQNHGFAVDPDSFSEVDVVPTHINMNDNSLAGLMLKDAPVYSIQYHPEASPGPHDSAYLFNKFQEDLSRAKK